MTCLLLAVAQSQIRAPDVRCDIIVSNSFALTSDEANNIGDMFFVSERLSQYEIVQCFRAATQIVDLLSTQSSCLTPAVAEYR